MGTVNFTLHITGPVWGWWLAFAFYLAAAGMCLVWITDGGTMHTRVARWRVFIVCIFWPLAFSYSLLDHFINWFLSPPSLPQDDI